MTWTDATRTLRMRLAEGSRMLSPEAKRMVVVLKGEKHEVSFDGKPLEVRFS
jgi:hypothetical protein